MSAVVNLILFQAGWFAVVLTAANHLEIISVLVVINIVAIHLFLVGNYKPEIITIVFAGTIGFIIDSLHIDNGVFSAVTHIGRDGVAPLWLVGLWMLFAITINHSLRWLKGRYLVAALAGFVFAPVAYYAGHKLGAIVIPADSLLYRSLLIIGTGWAIVMPIFVAIVAHLNKGRLTTGYQRYRFKGN